MSDSFGTPHPPVNRRLLTRARSRCPLIALVLGLAFAAAAPARAQTAPAQASPAPRFDIYQYVVEGNSTLTDPAIEAAVATHMGERRTIQDVEAARAALEKAYRDAGYLTVVVSIPEQDVSTGEVVLKVVEGTVERVRVRGAGFNLPSAVRAGVAELAEGTVPNFNTVQAQLAGVNRRADMRVTPVLRSGRLPGTVDVQLEVDDQLPLHGSLELNNRQTPNTTETRLSANLRYDNLFQRGHGIGMTLQVAPQRPGDAKVAALNYLLPGHSTRDAYALYLVHSRSAFPTLANAPGLGLIGNSDTLGLRYNRPIDSAGDWVQRLSAGADYKSVEQTITVANAGSIATPVRYVPLVVNYTANAGGDGAASTVDMSLAAGLRGLLGNSDASFQARRAGASAQFVTMRLGLQHTRTLGRWSLGARADTQLATGPLVPTEQMVAGGAESVRGYLEGERAGDLGLRVSFEARTPAYAPWGASSPWRLTGLVFLDAAWLKTLQPQAPQVGRHSLAGTGFGLRVVAPGGTTVEMDAARALVRGDSTASGETRLHARAIWAY